MESAFVAEKGDSDVIMSGFNKFTERLTKQGGKAVSENGHLLAYVSIMFKFPDYMKYLTQKPFPWVICQDVAFQDLHNFDQKFENIT